MTDREKEIRDAERKALAEVRRWKRETQKELEGLTDEEWQKHWDQYAEKLRARGYEVVSSLN